MTHLRWRSVTCTWDYAWNTAGYAQLAEMDFLADDYARALMHLNRAITTNGLINRLQVNKAIALRKLGYHEKSEDIIKKVLEEDKLDYFARNELYILQKLQNSSEAETQLNEMTQLMRDDEQSYMELSTFYSNLGLYSEAIDVLKRITANTAKVRTTNPIVYYTLAYLHHMEGNEDIANQYLTTSTTMPWQYCFPWREESIPVLEFAKTTNVSDAKASYFLGCLMYDMDPDVGIKEWEYSASIDDQFAYTYRNLAWGYNQYKKDVNKGIEYMEKAMALNDQDPRFYYELDKMYEKAGTSINKRANMLIDNHEVVVQRDDALSREVLVMVQLGQYDDAMNIFENHHFHKWEGVREVISIYQDVLVMRGIQRFKAENYKQALSDFKMSFAYPPNTDIGRPHTMARFAELYYYTGLALEKLGKNKEAKSYFMKVVSAEANAEGTEYLYYEGLAFEKLKNTEAANKSFEKLYEYANRERVFEGNTQFSVEMSEEEWISNNFYANGLFHKAKGNKEEAKKFFQKAVDQNPHLWASFWLNTELN